MALQLVQALWPGLCFASSPAPHVPLAAPASYPAIHSSSRGNRCQLLSMSTSASRRGARDRLAPGTSVQIRGDMERCEAGERTPPPPPPPVNLSFSYFGDSQATRRAIVRCRERVVGWRVGPSRKCAGRGGCAVTAVHTRVTLQKSLREPRRGSRSVQRASVLSQVLVAGRVQKR